MPIAGPRVDYHTDAVQAALAWAQGLEGNGVGVAVIDSGIAAVNDLNPNAVVYSQDFVGDGAQGTDLYGHGTHVAGIIAGNGAGSSGPMYSYTFKGIAPKVNLVNLRALDQNGVGSDSQVIAAIETAIQLKDTYNIRVLSLSVGRGVFESYTLDPLCQAVEQAWKAGIVVVVSAGNNGRNNAFGNNGYGTVTSPGNDPYVITVGAMNTLGTPDRTDDVPASYSSKGPSLFDQVIKPDLVAPGNLIVSLYKPGETLSEELPEDRLPNSAYITGAQMGSFGDISCVERHQHGGSHGERGGGPAAGTEPADDAGPGESAPDDDGVQEPCSGSHGQRSGDRPDIQSAGGYLHRGSGLPRYPGSVGG